MRLKELGNTCVVGLQWGDEGKGKIVDVLVEHLDVVVRYAGGANAGHTVVIGGEKFALHQLPSGILRENIISVIGCGAVIDPAIVLGEIQSLRERGVKIGDNLRISERAHVVFPYHRREDMLAEKAAPAVSKIGTTARGIGPCYADKISRRWGIRMCDLLHPQRLRDQLAAVVSQKNAYFAALYDDREPLDAAKLADEYVRFGEQLRGHVCDATTLLQELVRAGKHVLFEGAQGSLLDIDHGTYPFVTSSSAGAGGASSGSGLPPSAIRSVVGVLKAYSTRVGAGPFPTELTGATGEVIRERGGEYGTTTGRPRRCGWFDAVAASYAARIAGPTHLAVMHLDTLSGLEELRVCVAYRRAGTTLNSMPPDAYTLAEVEPVYETFEGWSEDISACRKYSQLPAKSREYVEMIGRRLGAPISMIGVGPDRDQTIMVESGVR